MNRPLPKPQPKDSKNQPIWDVIDEIVNQFPPEVFDALPKDGADQHDHYIYGLAKKPV